MKVITAYPVIYKNRVINRGGSEFSNITAASTSDSIKAYQNWYNKQSPKTPLTVDGVWGPKTSEAWNEKGQAYEKQMLGVATGVQNTMAGLFGGMQSAPVPENLSVSSPTGEKQKGKFWDKLKGTFVAAKEAGIIDAAAKTAGVSNPSKPKAQSKTAPSSEKPVVETSGKKGMTKTTKIIIGASVVLLLIVIVYSATKKSKKG